jgi:ketosteroid isomerase-like protein
MLPDEPLTAAAVVPSKSSQGPVPEDQAAADESARAAIESLSAGEGAAPAQVSAEDPQDNTMPDYPAPAQPAEAVPPESPAEALETSGGGDSSAEALEPPANAEVPEAAQPPLGADEALALLSDWLAAWSARDEEAYFSHYAPDFYSSDLKLHLKSFRRYRGRLMRQAQSIKVEAEEIEIDVSDQKAAIVFLQRYQSDSVSDVGLKTLTLAARDGAWKIISETFSVRP